VVSIGSRTSPNMKQTIGGKSNNNLWINFGTRQVNQALCDYLVDYLYCHCNNWIGCFIISNCVLNVISYGDGYRELVARFRVKLRLPICEIWCKIYQLFRLLVCFIFPFTDVRNFSDRNWNKINKRAKSWKNSHQILQIGKRNFIRWV